LGRMKCQQGAYAAQADYLRICRHELAADDSGLTAHAGIDATAIQTDADAGCHDALCVQYADTNKMAIDYFETHNDAVCQDHTDQTFLTKLDCAYSAFADGQARESGLGKVDHSHESMEILPTKGEIEGLVTPGECNINGTDAMEQALYDLHFTLQEQVLLKIFEHARTECLNLVENRATDISRYQDAVDQAYQAQKDLSNMILQYDDFHAKVGAATANRTGEIAAFIQATNEMRDNFNRRVSEAQTEINMELDDFLKDARATASNYKNDLAVYFENLASKKAHVKDAAEKIAATNDQIVEHGEDLDDLDDTLSTLLDSIVTALDNTDTAVDTIKDEGEEVLSQAVAPRDMTRSDFDQAATQPELLKSCQNGKIVKLKDDSDNDCDCDNLVASCELTSTGSAFSSPEHREDCHTLLDADGNVITDPADADGDSVCADNPEPDHIAERTHTVTRDNDDIIVRDDSDYFDDAHTAYDMYDDVSNENSNDSNGGDYEDTDGDDETGTIDLPTCGLCL